MIIRSMIFLIFKLIHLIFPLINLVALIGEHAIDFGNRLLIVILIIVIIFGSFAGLNIASIVEYQIQLAFGLCICGKF